MIKNLKPKRDSKFLEGYFRPKFPEKYVGNTSQIIFRSSYEKMMFIILDLDPKVIKWNSEGIRVKYYYPVDKKWHSYYPDVYFEKKDGDKIIKAIILQ